jgi:hypothetical protein
MTGSSAAWWSQVQILSAPFDTGQLSRRGLLAAGIAGGFALAARNQSNTQAQSSAATAVISTSSGGEAGVIPYSSNIEFPNPMRGQYEDLLVAEYWQGTSFPGTDNYERYIWADIHTGPNTFDFSQIETDMAAAAAVGKRFGMRIMMADYPYANAVPSWAQNVSGATITTSGSAGTAVYPNWNDPAYLSILQTLLNALAAQFDLDERLAYFEVSGYGDWSQWMCYEEVTYYGLSAPSPAQTLSQLGYYTNTTCDVITMSTITTVLGYHVAAFPNTRLVIASNNPEAVRQLLMGTNFAGESTAATTVPAIPPGIRNDGLGTESPVPFQMWGYPGGYYYNTPLSRAYLNNYTKAPWITEWNGEIGGGRSTSYLSTAMQEVVNYNVSMIGSCNNPAIESGLDSSDYEIWLRLIMYSGYRYSASASVSGNNVTVTWTNWGVAPAYDNWQIIYQVRNSSNAIVQTVDSTYSFLTLSAASQGPSYDWGGYVPGEYTSSPPTGTPTPITGNDSFTLASSLPAPASYTIWVQVTWNQHKPSATYTFNFPPMSLAMNGRDGTGAYQIGSFSN